MTANGVVPNGDDSEHDSFETEEPLDYRRPLRVAVIGAGFSGLYMTILAEKVLENVELVVYEKNPELGGTWFENTYPGLACDIPAHNYTYSFEPYAKYVG